MALGDGENDLPMLKTAALGVTLANGLPVVLMQLKLLSLTTIMMVQRSPSGNIRWPKHNQRRLDRIQFCRGVFYSV